MEELKYFLLIVKVEDSSERFELNRSVRPVVKFFSSKNAAEEWVTKKGAKYNLAPEEFSGRCLAAWEGKQAKSYGGWKRVKVALFKISEEGVFTMPKEWVHYVE